MSNADPRVIEALSETGIAYEVVEIDPEHADTAVFCKEYDYPLERSANTIIVASKKEPKTYVACVVLATTRLDVNRRVRKLMGVPKASFATAEEMKVLTGMEVGGVTALALPDDMPLWVDARIRDLDEIVLGAGSRGAKIKTSPAVLERLCGLYVEDLANPIDTVD